MAFSIYDLRFSSARRVSTNRKSHIGNRKSR